MGDAFNEQLVRRRPTALDGVKKAGFVAAAFAVFLLAGVFVPGFAIFIGAGALFGALYAMGFLNVEYEYALTNGELDVDIIYNKARRRRLFSVAVKEFELMAHVEDKAHSGAFGGARAALFCHSGATGPDTYAFLATIAGQRTKVVIEPNEKLLKALRQAMPRGRFHQFRQGPHPAPRPPDRDATR